MEHVEGKRCRHKVEKEWARDTGMGEVCAGVCNDAVMVKGEGCWALCEGKPGYEWGLIRVLWGVQCGTEPHKSNAHHMATWIAVRIAEGTNLLHIDIVYPRLFV
jgi:hypothetical protein